MKKDYLLMLGSVVLTLLLALGLIRWIAPGLLGVPTDLQLVQVDKKLPPFFEGVFRREDLQAKTLILQDPLTRIRAKPFYPENDSLGPHDILGFRNHSVPNMADIVAIGDSQTYGNNAVIKNNWPNQLERQLTEQQLRIYSMAVGGWGAVQYLDMFANATVFKPRAVIVAFYTGNDPIDSFQLAYGSPNWGELIPNHNLTTSDIPKTNYPPLESEMWSVKFKDGIETVFTPTLRLASNQDHPVIKAGYDIMFDVAKRITEMAKPMGIEVVFTIVPTKELAYSKKIELEGLNTPNDYDELIKHELKNIERLANSIKKLNGATYTDIVAPLQHAALSQLILYPKNANGHPYANGYRVIATTLEGTINTLLPKPANGLHAIQIKENEYQYSLVTNKGLWIFQNTDLIEANGWPTGTVNNLALRDIAALPLLGVIKEVDPKRFGPLN